VWLIFHSLIGRSGGGHASAKPSTEATFGVGTEPCGPDPRAQLELGSKAVEDRAGQIGSIFGGIGSAA
jgi:hypothetical protein